MPLLKITGIEIVFMTFSKYDFYYLTAHFGMFT